MMSSAPPKTPPVGVIDGSDLTAVCIQRDSQDSRGNQGWQDREDQQRRLYRRGGCRTKRIARYS